MMKKLVLIAITLGIFSLNVKAQYKFGWAVGMGDINDDIGNSVTMDALGNVYVTGRFKGTVEFDPVGGTTELTSKGGNDIFVLKLDASGIFLWAKAIGGISNDVGNSITTDASGNVYVTGSFEEEVEFDPGGTTKLISVGNTDIFVLKLNDSGNFLWAKAMGGTSFDNGYSITTDASGNSYMTGRFSGMVDFDPVGGPMNLTSNGGYDIFVLKLDASGIFLWAKAIGGISNDVGNFITTDASGNLYVTGYFMEIVNFDPGAGTMNLTSVANNDIFVLKLDASGIFLWAKAMGESGFDVGNSLTTDALGNLYVTGWFEKTVDFDPGAGEIKLASAGGTDIFVLKMNASGIFLWAKAMGGTSNDAGYSITTDALGNVHVTGYFQDKVDFDPGTGEMNLTSAGSIDIFTVKLDVSGNFLWAKAMGETGQDFALSNTTDASGNVYLTGYFQDKVDFDPGAGEMNLTSAGSHDIFTVKLLYCSPLVADVVSLGDWVDQCLVTIPPAPTATNQCGNFTGTLEDPSIFPISVQGTTVVTWNYDDGEGNTLTQTQNVIITDVTAPVAGDAGLTDLIECSVATPTAPTATDNCAGSITGTADVSFPIIAQGTTVVTWTYDDGNGNTSTQTQNVIITDVTAPVADAMNLADLIECPVATPTAPTATDNCAGSITGTPDVTFPITSQGITVITWTYEDGEGNTSTQTQNVIISDVTAPVADDAGLTDLTECSVATPTAPTATDNCADSITGTADVSFPIIAQGTTVVTWTYDDGNGNTSTQTQNVIITPIDNTVSQTDITLTATAGSYSYQWVDCNNGNAPISGESNQSFTPDTSGSYAVEISNGTCTVTSECIDMIILGITDELSDLGISVYPNPITDRLIIDKGENREIQIEILDNSGKLIISKTAKRKITSIDLSGYTPGVYFINLTNDEIRTVKRIIVK